MNKEFSVNLREPERAHSRPKQPWWQVEETFSEILHGAPAGTCMQAVVLHDGAEVASLAAGASPQLPVDAGTPFLTFSVSKVFTGMAVLKLVDEGRLDLDEPVARSWPEFARGGKETATIRHVLLHQAGVPAPHLYRQVFTWPSWRLVTAGLACEKAQYPPGSRTAYHLVNYGFILGEVVRRVSGQPLDLFLQQNYFKPMGLRSTWMRIPADALQRSPRLLTLTPGYKNTARLFNLPLIRRALIPAACLHSTARELAAFYQMLLDGGQYKGRSYLHPGTVSMAARSHYDGYDDYVKYHMNWGLGLIMGGGLYVHPDPRGQAMGWGSSAATFAGMGMGTCMVWADRNARLVTAFTSNHMLPEPQISARWAAISNSAWDSLKDQNLL